MAFTMEFSNSGISTLSILLTTLNLYDLGLPISSSSCIVGKRLNINAEELEKEERGELQLRYKLQSL